MGLNLSTYAVSELRIRGFVLAVVGLVLTVIGVALHGAVRLEEAFVGAVVFGAWAYWALRRCIGQLLAQAGTVRAAVSEPSVDTRWRAVAQLTPALAIFLVLSLALRNVASLAGIPLGAGLALLVIEARLIAWEDANALRLLHQIIPGARMAAGWLNALRPADYSLCAAAGVTPVITHTSARPI